MDQKKDVMFLTPDQLKEETVISVNPEINVSGPVQYLWQFVDIVRQRNEFYYLTKVNYFMFWST